MSALLAKLMELGVITSMNVLSCSFIGNKLQAVFFGQNTNTV